jgi:hypothetical protein
MSTLCTWCGSDVYVDAYDPATDEGWCSGPGHSEPRLFNPAAEKKLQKEKHAPSALGYGIAYELGIYDALPELLVAGEWADTPTVEYRFGTAYPDVYEKLLARWGHVAQSPRKYSVTSFIGSTLGQLSRATNVTHKGGHASGFFSYNSTVGFWTLEPVPAETVDTGWEQCATAAGIDPDTWPLA